MKIKIKNVRLSRTILAGLLAGIICAALDAGLMCICSSAADMNIFAAFSPIALFVGIPLLFLCAGIIFFELAHLKVGVTIYKIIFAALTLLSIAMDLGIFTGIKGIDFVGPTGIVFGLELVTGLLLTFLLPYFATHPRLFMTEEGIMFSEGEDK